MDNLPDSLPYRSIEEWSEIAVELSITHNITILYLMRRILNLIKLAKDSNCRNITVDHSEFREVIYELRRYNFDPNRQDPINQLVYGIAQSIVQMVESLIEANSPSQDASSISVNDSLDSSQLCIKGELNIDRQISSEHAQNCESIEVSDVKPRFFETIDISDDNDELDNNTRLQNSTNEGGVVSKSVTVNEKRSDVLNDRTMELHRPKDTTSDLKTPSSERLSSMKRAKISLSQMKETSQENEDQTDDEYKSRSCKRGKISVTKRNRESRPGHSSLICPLCNVSSTSICRHFEVHHRSMQREGFHVKCDVCHTIIDTYSKWTDHKNECDSNSMTIHSTSSTIQSASCDNSFDRSQSVLFENIFTCHLCEESSTYSTDKINSFYAHLQNKHRTTLKKEGIKFSCSQCSNEIPSARQLLVHSKKKCDPKMMKMFRIAEDPNEKENQEDVFKTDEADSSLIK